jgi:hypothetical protein
MPHSLKVRVECLETVTLAVKHAAFPTQRALAEDLGLALSTVRNFLTGKPFIIQHSQSFVRGCHWSGKRLLTLATRLQPSLATPNLKHKQLTNESIGAMRSMSRFSSDAQQNLLP